MIFKLRNNNLRSDGTNFFVRYVAEETPVPVVPSAIDNVLVATSTTTESAADISWIAPADGGAAITGYKVYYSNDFGTTWILHGTVASSPYEMQIPYRGGNSVYVDVRAVNSVGDGPTALLLGNATLSDSVPGSPSIYAIVQQPGVDLEVQWNNPEYPVTPSISEYEVEYTVSGMANYATTTNLGYYTVDLSTMNIGQEITFRVRASNSLGYGPWSDPETQYAADVPNVADYLYASASMSTQGAIEIDGVIVPGNNGSTIISFDVQLNQSDDFGSPEKQETFSYNGTDLYTSGTVTGLVGGTLYYIRIRFTNAVGSGEWSASFSSLSSASVPGEVQNFSTNIDNDLVEWNFAWTIPNNGGYEISGYEIQESSYDNEWLPETGMTTYYVSGESTSSYVAAIMTADVIRYFRIRATNIYGSGPWSAISNAIYNTPTAPQAPTIISAVWDGTSTTVVWTSGSDGGSLVTGQTFFFNGTITSPDSTGANTANFNFDARGFDVEMYESNAIGDGPTSDLFYVVGIPDPPNVTNAYWNGTDTVVEYNEPYDGGSAITSRTFVFNGSPTAPSSDYSGVATFAGNNFAGYSVEVSSTNAYGTSVYSTSVTVNDNS